MPTKIVDDDIDIKIEVLDGVVHVYDEAKNLIDTYCDGCSGDVHSGNCN